MTLDEIKDAWKNAWREEDTPGVFFGCASSFGQWVQKTWNTKGRNNYLIWRNHLYDLYGNPVNRNCSYGYLYCEHTGNFLREAKKEEFDAVESLLKINGLFITDTFFDINTEIEKEFAVNFGSRRRCFICDRFAPRMLTNIRQVGVENDAVWWRTISVLTPKQRINELYNQIKKIDSEMILMNSYLETSKNLMVYWNLGKNHHELTAQDADTVTRYHIMGVKMTRYYQTVFDLMMSGF